MGERIEINKNMKFGKLTVIKEGETLIIPSGQSNRTIICKCDCGNVKQIRLLHLVRGRISSCGCLSGEHHNETKTLLYKKWCAVKNRCNINYRLTRYEILKVTICNEWAKSYLAFKKWALANGYKDGLQIDRIDNTKGYYPDNCRFVTNIVNVNNRNNTFKIKYHGNIMPFMELIHSKQLWLSMGTIRTRILRGWTPNKAFDTPIRKGNYVRVNHTKEQMLKKLHIKHTEFNRNV